MSTMSLAELLKVQQYILMQRYQDQEDETDKSLRKKRIIENKGKPKNENPPKKEDILEELNSIKDLLVESEDENKKLNKKLKELDEKLNTVSNERDFVKEQLRKEVDRSNELANKISALEKTLEAYQSSLINAHAVLGQMVKESAVVSQLNKINTENNTAAQNNLFLTGNSTRRTIRR